MNTTRKDIIVTRKKKRLSNCLTKHESVLIAHENVLIAHESGWILHEKGLMQHDNLKNRVFPPWNFNWKLKLSCTFID